jgi:hypothetical protein
MALAAVAERAMHIAFSALLIACTSETENAAAPSDARAPGADSGSDATGTESGGAGGGGGSGGVAAADSSGTSGSSGTCPGPCCELPSAGDSCSSADEGVVCPGSEVCAGGLVLERSFHCRTGMWNDEGEPCPPLDGGTTADGCPAAQPANGAACAEPDGRVECGYKLSCPLAPCDSGEPAFCPTEKAVSTTAVCVDGRWSTNPLTCE